MEEHLPERPSWDCGKCGEAWPCAIAKVNLSIEYLGSRSALLLYLGIQHWVAFDDYAASGAIPADLHERFLGWVR